MRQGTLALLVLGCHAVAACGAHAGDPGASQSRQATGSPSTLVAESSESGTESSAGARADDGAERERAYPQTPDAAFVAEAAERRGWTIEQYTRFQAGSDALGAAMERVSSQRPELFVGGAVGPEHDAAPRLYIKGPADDFVRDLVAEAPVEIALIDEQPFSADEIWRRNARVGSLLRQLGYTKYAVASDIQRRAMLEIEVVPAPGAPETPGALLAALPPEFRQGIEIVFWDDSEFRYEED